MFPSRALLSLIFISLAVVDASPLTRGTGKNTLSFATRFTESGTINLVEKDRARAQAFMNAGYGGQPNPSAGVTNAAFVYTAEVGVGNPATNYTLIIDTGSSNTWIGASKSYNKTSTSQDTGKNVSVSYGSGSFSGEEWIDRVTLAPGLVIPKQSIGVASTATGFGSFDGILGVGPVDLTSTTVSGTNEVPTVMDNLLTQKTISEEVLGVYYIPASVSNSGTLTFGGYDNSVITSSVKYVPLTTTSPSAKYWGIDQSITYGNTTIMSSTAGIVDTGTTLILIASDAFQKYQSATGATQDYDTGLLTITSSQYSALKPLTFHIGGTSYNLSPNAQIWPRSLNSIIGGSSGSIYLIVANLGIISGTGLEFINGYTFLERYYSVYDTTNKRIGFASTAYTKSTKN